MRRSSRTSHQERLLKLTCALLDGEQHDRYSAAKKLGVKHAAAYDMLKLIAKYRPEIRVQRGTPVRFGRPEGVADEPVAVAPALAASFAAGFARAFRNTVIETELVGIRDRTLHRLGTNGRRRFQHIDRKVCVLTPEETDIGGREKTLLNVIEAVLGQRKIRVEYHGFDRAPERMTLEPYSLVALSSKLYVVAPRDGVPHPYRFDRIRRATLTNETFDYPEVASYEPRSLFDSSMGIWLSEPNPCRVVVRLSRRWAVYARHHKWHHSQQETFREDG